jgi:pyruvate/2-oxoglutarate dehydrogenase complex dihydrolipoamide dehydrogenase (E3) component
MTKPRAYDLVVIGGGPAGLSAATTAAALGKTVALVDSHHELGGAVLTQVQSRARLSVRRL